MRLKQGVELKGLTPQIALALQVAEGVYNFQADWKGHWDPEMVVTSLSDGRHSPNSLHTRDGLCRAVDLRTHNVLNPEVLVQELKFRLGEEFDIIFEHSGTPNAHIHIEYDPK